MVFRITVCCRCSVAQSCPTLCNPMNCSTPGLPVPHHLPEFAQLHVHWISDAIQPSHLLSPSSPFAFSLSQNRYPFQRVSSWHQAAKVLELSISPSNEYSGLISFKIHWFDLLAVQETLKSLYGTTVVKHQFFGTWPSLRSKSYNCTWLLFPFFRLTISSQSGSP